MDLARKLVKIWETDGAADTGGKHLTPRAELTLNGKVFGTETMSRIISISLIDKRGFEADELTVELNDYDGALAIPPAGSKITLALGYEETRLIDKGDYILSEFSVQGSPDTLSITARSADIADSLAEQKDKSWHKTTLYTIVETIAKSHNYPYAINENYKQAKIDHIDQTGESDAGFLTRLAEHYDAIATVKGGRLIFAPMGNGQAASGLKLPTLNITRSEGDRHSFTYNAAAAYNAVKARYTDKRTGRQKEVVVDKSNARPERKNPAESVAKGRQKQRGKNTERKIDTAGLKVKTLRHLYAGNAAAWAGARAAYRKLERGVAQFSLTLASGRPDLIPELPVTVQGFKPEIDNQKWLIMEVAHSFGQSGYTCSVKLEAYAEVD
nr:contractile injection system protein, VgrG/Pvc8 family [uncultured Kingella sp.]